MDKKILIYTRIPKDDYTESLANSIHFAYFDNDNKLIPLNQNYGILFALAIIDENDVIHEKGIKNPYIFRTEDGLFGITATRTDKFGIEDEESKGYVMFWTSRDLTEFTYHGLLKQQSAPYETERPVIDRNDIIPGNVIFIDRNMLHALQKHWEPVYNTEIRVSKNITVTSEQELNMFYATAVYSDGSTAIKQVQWDLNGIDLTKPGTYHIKGKVVQETFPFPLTHGYADPVILPWNGKYYFLSTNDNKSDIGIYVRESDTKSELFVTGFNEALLLDKDEEKGFIQTFWAPEFHWIGGELYILFAVGGKQWAPQCHMMKLKKDGNIMNPADWNVPQRVRRSDGAFLAEDGITLDMTYFKANGVSCVVWSYRKHLGTPFDTGSMLYIATIDEKNPTMLTSEPVLLSRPLYGWENIQGTINNEGPYPLITNDTVYIAYSGGAANGYTYAIGLLSIPIGGNYLDAREWTKSSTPALSYYSIVGVYGPGHNSFFRDYDGNTYIVYHAEEQLVKSGNRCSAMHRIHFNKNGKPLLNMSADRDLNQSLTDIHTLLTIV